MTKTLNSASLIGWIIVAIIFAISFVAIIGGVIEKYF